MLSKVIRFVRLGLLVLLIFAIGRFVLGLAGVPYTPRGNAIFSVVMQTIVTAPAELRSVMEGGWLAWFSPLVPYLTAPTAALVVYTVLVAWNGLPNLGR